MPKQETIMLTPGTLRVSPRVLQASASAQFNHRAPEVQIAFDEIKSNLRKILSLTADYALVFFPTSGRGGLEALISAVVISHPTLIVVNGRWSAYSAEVAQKYKSSVSILKLPEDKPIDISTLKEEIARQKPAVVYFVSHETERGLLNPTKEIVQVCKEAGCAVVVDAMSSVVVEDTDFASLGVDAFCFNASKGLRSLRDMGIIAIKKSFAEGLNSNGQYLNFGFEYQRQVKTLPRNPFPTSAVLALREATRELLEEGVENRRASIKKNMQILHNWANQKGLEWITKPEYLGWCTLPLRLPKGWTYSSFRNELLKHGYDVYYSYDGEEGVTFEVSTVGYLSEDEVRGFTKVADKILWA